MAREDAYGALPEAYATALRLQAAGADADEIAARLSIDADAVPALLRLANAKLAERPSTRARHDGARSES